MNVSEWCGFERPEFLLEALLLKLPNGSLNIFDRDFRYLLVGGEGLEAVGLTPSYLQGRTLYELFPSSFVALVEPSFRRVFAGDRVRFEVRLFGHDYHMSAAPFRYESGEVVSIIVIAQDITDESHIQQLHAAADPDGVGEPGIVGRAVRFEGRRDW